MTRQQSSAFEILARMTITRQFLKLAGGCAVEQERMRHVSPTGLSTNGRSFIVLIIAILQQRWELLNTPRWFVSLNSHAFEILERGMLRDSLRHSSTPSFGILSGPFGNFETRHVISFGIFVVILCRDFWSLVLICYYCGLSWLSAKNCLCQVASRILQDWLRFGEFNGRACKGLWGDESGLTSPLDRSGHSTAPKSAVPILLNGKSAQRIRQDRVKRKMVLSFICLQMGQLSIPYSFHYYDLSWIESIAELSSMGSFYGIFPFKFLRLGLRRTVKITESLSVLNYP